jgi:RNA polymerase sigma-70 factor, ECF subfamily
MADRPSEGQVRGGREGSEREPSDHSLLRGIQQGSEDAARRLYRRYARRLESLARARLSPGLARRLDPEDIVQSVFSRFFVHVRRGDFDIPEGEELWKLFLVITLNRIRSAESHHRADKRNVSVTSAGDQLDTLPTRRGRLDETAEFLRMVVEEALGQLPARYQEVVRLRLEAYEVAEIAQRTGRSQRTVERILHESRDHLGALLHDLS